MVDGASGRHIFSFMTTPVVDGRGMTQSCAKVILWIGMSFDGFTSGPNENLDWLVRLATTPESQAFFRALRQRSDTILLGRVNYEGFHGYWPAVQNDPKASPDDRDISRWLDDVPKIVFSRTLTEVSWKNARLAKGTPQEEIGALKAMKKRIDLRPAELTRFENGAFVARYEIKKSG